MASFTSSQNGPWGSASTWGGAGVPGDGDFASIGNTVTINQNIGTAGNGIKRITITNGGALLFDAVTNRTLTFGSTGIDPIGSGSPSAPGNDATMFGIFQNNTSGRVFLAGSPSAILTITTGNGVDPWYLSTFFQQSDFALKYCDLFHVGANVQFFEGLNLSNVVPGTAIILDHCRITSLFELVLFAGNTPNVSFTNVLFSGVLSGAQTIGGNGFAQGSINVQNCVEINPVADHLFFNIGSRPPAFTFEGNALLGTSAAALGFGLFMTAGLVQSNLCVNVKSTSGLPAFQMAGGTVTGNYSEGSFGASLECNNAAGLVARGNFFSQQLYSAGAQGIIDGSGVSGSSFTFSVLLYETASLSVPTIGALLWGAGILNNLVDHLTILAPPAVNGGPGGFSQGWAYGEPGDTGSGNIIRNSILAGWQTGFQDEPGVGYAPDFAGVGIHHNAYYLNVADFMNPSGQGEPNFWDGVNPHPSSVYGEVSLTSSPGFVNPLRRVAGYDALLGGPGTAADFITQLSFQSGFGGVYNPAFNIPAMVAWVLAGFSPRNPALDAAFGGGWIGAVAGVLPDVTLSFQGMKVYGGKT